MENYIINFEESDRETVLAVLNKSNDVLINNLSANSVGITIQLDDAEPLYHTLLEKIQQEVEHQTNPSIRRT